MGYQDNEFDYSGSLLTGGTMNTNESNKKHNYTDFEDLLAYQDIDKQTLLGIIKKQEEEILRLKQGNYYYEKK